MVGKNISKYEVPDLWHVVVQIVDALGSFQEEWISSIFWSDLKMFALFREIIFFFNFEFLWCMYQKEWIDIFYLKLIYVWRKLKLYHICYNPSCAQTASRENGLARSTTNILKGISSKESYSKPLSRRDTFWPYQMIAIRLRL